MQLWSLIIHLYTPLKRSLAAPPNSSCSSLYPGRWLIQELHLRGVTQCLFCHSQCVSHSRMSSGFIHVVAVSKFHPFRYDSHSTGHIEYFAHPLSLSGHLGSLSPWTIVKDAAMNIGIRERYKRPRSVLCAYRRGLLGHPRHLMAAKKMPCHLHSWCTIWCLINKHPSSRLVPSTCLGSQYSGGGGDGPRVQSRSQLYKVWEKPGLLETLF